MSKNFNDVVRDKLRRRLRCEMNDLSMILGSLLGFVVGGSGTKTCGYCTCSSNE